MNQVMSQWPHQAEWFWWSSRRANQLLPVRIGKYNPKSILSLLLRITCHFCIINPQFGFKAHILNNCCSVPWTVGISHYNCIWTQSQLLELCIINPNELIWEFIFFTVLIWIVTSKQFDNPSGRYLLFRRCNYRIWATVRIINHPFFCRWLILGLCLHASAPRSWPRIENLKVP